VATFGLLHGGSHGAWCWERIVPELEGRGHRAVGMDLHMDRPDVGLFECAATAAEALAGEDGPILVGHSIAGTFLPLAAERAGASMMVFLCAMVPVAGQSLADQQAADPSMVSYPYSMVSDEQGRTLATPEVARAMYYPDCTDEDVAWAVDRLVPQAPTVRFQPYPSGTWPDIPVASIVCRHDTVVSPDWSRRVTRERLGVEPVEMDGAHSPMLSRPAELARVLDGLASTDDSRELGSVHPTTPLTPVWRRQGEGGGRRRPVGPQGATAGGPSGRP
jgi:hypothetical protein